MQTRSAPLQELSGIFYSSPNLNTQSKRYPQAIKAIKLSSIKLNSPLHSYLIVLGVSRAAVLGSCGSCSRVWVSHQLCRAFGSLAPTAVPRGCFWCCQLDWAIPNGSCVPNKNEFCICLGSCPGRGRGGGAQVLAPPGSVPALGQTHTCKGKVTSANLQIPARACSRRFICIHLLYDTDFPYQWLVTPLLRVDGSSWAMKSCCDSLQSPSPRISTTHFQFVRPFFSMTPPGNFSSPVRLHRCVPGVSNRQAQRFFSTYIKTTVKCSWD